MQIVMTQWPRCRRARGFHMPHFTQLFGEVQASCGEGLCGSIVRPAWVGREGGHVFIRVWSACLRV